MNCNTTHYRANSSSVPGDPTYSAILRGDGSANAIAVDASGSAFVAGRAGPSFVATPGALDTTHGGGGSDAFVVKLAPDGSRMNYATLLGGDADDIANGIAVDGSGHAYVTGETGSRTFPTTPGAFDTTFAVREAFVAKLAADGASLVYSSYLGGSSEIDTGLGVAVDPQGRAVVAGGTGSPDFPRTLGAALSGDRDAFVAKLAADGRSLVYSTLFGGSGEEYARAVAVDERGGAFFTGHSTSSQFPTTPGTFDPTPNGGLDAFVVRLAASGTVYYATALGGADTDQGMGIAVDAESTAYVTGATVSADFPTSSGAVDRTLDGTADAFVTTLSSSGSRVYDSTFLGGSNIDIATAIAVDAGGSAYVAGATFSPDFPVNAIDGDLGGGADAFVTKLQANDTTITSGPSGPTSSNWPAFGFRVSIYGSRSECSLIGPGPKSGTHSAFTPCWSPARYQALAPGDYTFRVRAIDPFGNVDRTPATRSFTVLPVT